MLPFSEWEKRQPLRRALLAFENYGGKLDGLVRRIPEHIQVRGEEVAGILRPLTSETLFLRLWGRGKKPRSFPLRGLIQESLRAADLEQLPIERRFSHALAEALQELRANWRRRELELDSALCGVAGALAESGPSPVSSSERIATVTQETLAELDRLSEALPHSMARRISAGLFWPKKVTSKARRDPRGTQLEGWTGQLNSIESELRFERDLFHSEMRLLEVGVRACAELESERRTLSESIDTLTGRFVRLLGEGGAGEKSSADSPAIAPASSRSREFHTASLAVLSALPEELMLLKGLESSPGRRLVWRALNPAALAKETFEGTCGPKLDALFSKAEAEHLGISQQIDRAIQVVEYGTSGQEHRRSAEETSIAREALENALALLEAERGPAGLSLSEERRLVEGTLSCFFTEYRSLLRRSRLGALTHLQALGLKSALTVLVRDALRMLGRIARAIGRGGLFLQRRFLIAIHWIPAEEPDAIEVVRRPYLPHQYVVDPHDRDLPSIYQRLFKFEAIEDPRFLVGREEELSAIAEARARWEEGRPVAVLIVGTPGSGKTSLINCALQESLGGLEILRGEITDRVTTAVGFRRALAETLGLSDSESIEAELSARRRVVVLEEIERTFLREAQGFEANRELQRLIAATCHSTLWVIACSQQAFHLLARALKFADSFSHRIDTASVSAKCLRDAILVRHNLSGLRLRFLSPPGTRMSAALRRVGIRRRTDPEETFFLQLAEGSAGVFRAAFQLWLAQIGVVRSRTLRMKPIAAPEIEAIVADLDQDDLFTLLSLMQHGSLTADEHARVFQRSLAESQTELDELLARELIGPDPLRRGFGLHPSATRVVWEALHRHNLG